MASEPSMSELLERAKRAARPSHKQPPAAVQAVNPSLKPVVPGVTPILTCMEDVKPEQVRWLWPARIALGRLTLLAGPAGLGKSLLTAALAAHITRGMAWPDGPVPARGSVLFITAEDDPGDTIRPRLDQAGADPRKVFHLPGVRATRDDGSEVELGWTLDDCDSLALALDRIPDCKLVVVDPVGSYLGGRLDAHRDNEVRAALAPLGKLAAERGVAVLLVCHVRKSTSATADDMVLGSRAFTALCRGTLHLVQDERSKDRKLLLPGKCNLAKQAPGLAFTIHDGPRIVWEEGTLDLKADDHYSELSRPGPDPEQRSEAEDFLREALATGPKLFLEIKSEAKELGISEKTLRRAQKAVGAVAFRPVNPGPWYWRLGDRGHVAMCPESREPGHLGHVLKRPENQGFLEEDREHMATWPGSQPLEDELEGYDPEAIFGLGGDR